MILIYLSLFYLSGAMELDEWEDPPNDGSVSPTDWSGAETEGFDAEDMVGFGQPPVLPVDDEDSDEQKEQSDVPFSLRIS